MGLEFVQGDWLEHLERQKENAVSQIVSQLSKENPGIFDGALMGESKDLEAIVRQAVLTRSDLVHQSQAEDIVSDIMGQATGYGPLREFFLPENEDVTEVFVNPTKDGPRVFYGKHGRICPAEKLYFRDNEEALRYFQKICEDAGRPFTSDACIVDAWLRDGSRVAVVGFKASPLGVMGSIRKSPTKRPPMPLERLVQYQMLPQFAADLFVDLLVDGHGNIGTFGRTDSAKTTLLRALGLHIDPMERTFIAETSFEMFMPNIKNVINLVEVTYGDQKIVDMSLLCNTMNRNNPDRSIVGEIRSREIKAASQIASSTPGGFWTTGHAGDVNSLRTRLWGMFLDAGVQLPRDFLDEIIASMFKFIIFLDKETITEERKRTLMQLVEVVPGEGYRTIIRFDTDEFAASGGKTRRWIYENPVKNLSDLAFRGAKIKPEYEQVKEKYLY